MEPERLRAQFPSLTDEDVDVKHVEDATGASVLGIIPKEAAKTIWAKGKESGAVPDPTPSGREETAGFRPDPE